MKIVFVHAHPDDETLASGALIAALTPRHQVSLLTATRGEMGEAIAGTLDNDTSLAEIRENELSLAAKALGIKNRTFLGEPPARVAKLNARSYRDSGMRWIKPGLAGPSAESADDSLFAAELQEAALDCKAYLENIQPDLVITYDSDGGYGHPDHIKSHHFTLFAAKELGIPVAALKTDPLDSDRYWQLTLFRKQLLAALKCYSTQFIVGERTLTHVGGQVEDITTATGLKMLSKDAQILESLF